MTQGMQHRPFDIEGASPGFRDDLKRYSGASAATRARRPCRLDVAYGDGPAERLDIFTTQRPRAPVVVFIHGGGWRASSKSDRSFPADVFCEAGAVWVSLEYPLAPGATLDEMVASVRRGIAWVWRHAETFGGDPARIFVCGNSAGGHLTGMALGTDWPALGVPADVIKGATTVSGVFEMVSHMNSPANDWLRLDLDAAVRNSPLYNLPRSGCRLICAVGSDEPPEFIEQSQVYASAWRNRGFECRYLHVTGKHHFSIIGELGRRESELLAALFGQIGLG